jgi:hypothetical protein
MRTRSFGDEAEACRRQAALFAGRPEAPFLLRVAQSFEELESAMPLDGHANRELASQLPSA